jgi:hypothetical protein
MNTQCSDVGSCFAANVEYGEVALVVEFVECTRVDRADSELTLDSGNEWWTLEKSTSQGLQSARKLCLSTRNLLVEAYYAHILFSGTLL